MSYFRRSLFVERPATLLLDRSLFKVWTIHFWPDRPLSNKRPSTSGWTVHFRRSRPLSPDSIITVLRTVLWVAFPRIFNDLGSQKVYEN